MTHIEILIEFRCRIPSECIYKMPKKKACKYLTGSYCLSEEAQANALCLKIRELTGVNIELKKSKI